ncbi:amidoligase family protein [Pseudomaricurvus albidus]|uniref:amidoligase family protein n=1 Tax=Pseudomaricurvus albidus TaxID=2842452 RepID=UPI001F19CAAC|nr:amidoligase family protein [Aestuariicella albida]
MTSVPDSVFTMPSITRNSDGQIRTVGFELEFSGITLADTVAAVVSSLEGAVVNETAAEVSVETVFGKFNVEVDWEFLKSTAAGDQQADDPDLWLQKLSEAAALLVPIEVVCPPIPVTEISRLENLVVALRNAGAVGTEESLIAAYGVHINPEIPALDAGTIYRYLRAFVLLQWWLVDAHKVDLARRVSPYIDLFSESYIKCLLSCKKPTLETLIDDYLQFNASRNRALDMLPLFAEIDSERVRSVIDDPKIKARPTFHYRLPNCLIDKPEWNLSLSWNLWCVVEQLANDEAALESLGDAFLAADRPVIGVDRSAWVERITQWRNDHA